MGYFPCSVCDSILQSLADRKIHMRIHANEKIYKCTICTKGFVQKSNLNTHITMTHTDDRRHECGICQKRFFRNSDLKLHKQTHVQQRLFKCTKCNKKFKTGSTLQGHLKLHTMMMHLSVLFVQKPLPENTVFGNTQRFTPRENPSSVKLVKNILRVNLR